MGVVKSGQLALPDVANRPSRNGVWWGGRRRGAGRKPKNGVKAGASHATRPAPSSGVPMHISLRVLGDVPRLRQRRGYQIARRALGNANRFEGARICEISIQHNHVHLLVEADDGAALTRAMRSFAITLAKNVNVRLTRRGVARRRGPVVEDRYHIVALRTPAQVRAAIAYVLCNWRRHGEDRRIEGPPRLTDRYSSGPFFAGWNVPLPPLIHDDDLPFPEDGRPPTKPASSWLLRDGWKLGGLLSPWTRPGPLH
jgi:REP element-mobilizing transposase RayT